MNLRFVPRKIIIKEGIEEYSDGFLQCRVLPVYETVKILQYAQITIDVLTLEREINWIDVPLVEESET